MLFRFLTNKEESNKTETHLQAYFSHHFKYVMSKFKETEVLGCFKKVKAFFKDWSPMGYTTGDEYDDLFLQICGLINKSATGKEVEKQLETLFQLLYTI